MNYLTQCMDQMLGDPKIENSESGKEAGISHYEKEKKQAPEEKKVNTEETADQTEKAGEEAKPETPTQAEGAQTKEETLEAAAKARPSR